MNDDIQFDMCYRGASFPARLYRAVEFARDELGMTREEFLINVARRPKHYECVAYLANIPDFWKKD